jgi:hypothetical protein
MSANLTAGALAVVAVAGGTGAVLGAVITQTLQWLREGRSEKRAEARAIEKERRDHKRESYVELIQNLKAMQRAVRQIHLDLLRISIRSNEESHVSERLARWKMTAVEVDRVYATCQVEAAAYASKPLRTYLDFFGRFQPLLSPPDRSEEADRPSFGYKYATFDSTGIQLITTVGSGNTSIMTKNIGTGLRAIEHYLEWGIDTARFEMQIDAEPPNQLPYQMRVTRDYFRAEDT